MSLKSFNTIVTYDKPQFECPEPFAQGNLPVLKIIIITSYFNQSVTFWCRYWSRDWNRDHFGLENGLETGLVTLGSVTFWSQNGLETGLRPFWSQKRSRDPVSSLSAQDVTSSNTTPLQKEQIFSNQKFLAVSSCKHINVNSWWSKDVYLSIRILPYRQQLCFLPDFGSPRVLAR